MRQSIIKKVHQKISTLSLDEASEAVERAELFFLTYTNRKTVPKTAFYLLVDLAISFSKNDAGENQDVKSIKEGDTTVEFEEDDAKKTLHYYEKSLKMFRRARMK